MGYEAADSYYPTPLGTARSSYQRTLTFGANAGDVILCTVEWDQSTAGEPAPQNSSNISWSAYLESTQLSGEGQLLRSYRGKVTGNFSADTETVTVSCPANDVTYTGAFFVRYSPTAGKQFATEPVQQEGAYVYNPAPTATDACYVALTTTGGAQFQLVGIAMGTESLNLTDLTAGTNYSQRFEGVRQNNSVNAQPFKVEDRTAGAVGAGTYNVPFTVTPADASTTVFGFALEEVDAGGIPWISSAGVQRRVEAR